LDERKLKSYLEAYKIQSLYQKTGFLLELYSKEMQLSQDFFDYCKSKIGKSTRYLLRETDDDCYYNREWKLVVPEDLSRVINQGGGMLV